MSDFLDLPIVGETKRLFISTSSLTMEEIEDDDNKVIKVIVEYLNIWYEIDMTYNNIKKLVTSKSIIAVGKRKVEMNVKSDSEIGEILSFSSKPNS